MATRRGCFTMCSIGDAFPLCDSVCHAARASVAGLSQATGRCHAAARSGLFYSLRTDHVITPQEVYVMNNIRMHTYPLPTGELVEYILAGYARAYRVEKTVPPPSIFYRGLTSA